MALSYETELNNLKEAQRNAAIADLQNARSQALSNLEAEKSQNTAAYNQQRSTANAQNRMSAKNFQEYLASTGRANSGLSAQARMQQANNLATNLNYLNAGEAGALADINRRSTLANDTYNSGLASANANIEANYIQNLLNERQKEWQRDMQERQLQEQIRQFNENLALQQRQLQSRFSSGSGGGGSSSGGASSDGYEWTEGGQNGTGRDAVKDGEVYRVDTGTQTQLYVKNANGPDERVLSYVKPSQQTVTKKQTTQISNPFPKKTF